MQMKKCPFFNICGGCQYDFTDAKYRANKSLTLPKLNYTDNPIWGDFGQRRRADFAFVDGHFGFFKAQSKDIIDVKNCPNIVSEINAVLPNVVFCEDGYSYITPATGHVDVTGVTINTIPKQ